MSSRIEVEAKYFINENKEFLKLIENPEPFQPSPPKIRRKIVQINGDTNQISIPKGSSPAIVPTFS